MDLFSPRTTPYAQRPIVVTLVSLGKGDEVSLAKCMEVPESRSAGVDEMREMASTIKTEVLAELKVEPNSLGLCRLQHSDDLQVDLPGKGENFTRRAEKKQHVENDVSMACAKF